MFYGLKKKQEQKQSVDNLEDDIFMEDKPSLLSKITIDPKDLIGFLIRLVFCFVGVFVLKYFEQENLSKLKGQKAIVSEELNTLQAEEKKLTTQVDTFGKMKERSKEFNNKLNIMQKIANNRLSAVTGLDQIQSVIPEEVWLEKVAFKDRKFELQGYSTTNKQIQNFVEKLEQTNLFSTVGLERVAEDRSKRRRRSFTVTSILKGDKDSSVQAP